MSDNFSVGMSVNLSGYYAYLKELGQLVHDPQIEAALRDAGEVFITEARAILEENSPPDKYPQVVTKALWNSIKLEVKRTGPGKFRIQLVASAPYASSVEFKTPRKKRMPSYQEILRWWSMKTGGDRETAARIWQSIKKNGVQHHPFMRPALRSQRKAFQERLRKNLRFAIMQKRAKAMRMFKAAMLRRRSMIAGFRALLYQFAYILGWMQALGLDITALRSGIYFIARGMGDFAAISGARLASRMTHRVTGGITTSGLGFSLPNTDPLVDRILRVSAGKLTGKELRKLFR